METLACPPTVLKPSERKREIRVCVYCIQDISCKHIIMLSMQSCMIHILNHAYLTRRCSKIFFFKKKVSQKPAFPWTDGPTRNAFFIPSSSEKLCTSSARLLPSAGSNCRSRLVPGPLLTDDVMRTKAQFGVSDDFTSSRLRLTCRLFPVQILEILMPAGICIPRKSSVASLVLFRSGQLLHR